MGNPIKKLGAIMAVSLGLAAAPHTADAILFDISWTGGGNYSMTGMFGYDDSLIGKGAIDEGQIDSLMIEVFLGAVSQGTRDLGTQGMAGIFNFNFDTSAESFVVGGGSVGIAGQLWNQCTLGGDVGFVSDSGFQAVCVGGNFIMASFLDVSGSTLTATRKVPEPSTLALFAFGLAGLGFMTRRRRTGVDKTKHAS